MRLKLEIYYRDGILYKKDTYLPEFSWKIQPCQWDDTAKILLRSRKKEYLCKCRPTDVSNIGAHYISYKQFFRSNRTINLLIRGGNISLNLDFCIPYKKLIDF